MQTRILKASTLCQLALCMNNVHGKGMSGIVTALASMAV